MRLGTASAVVLAAIATSPAAARADGFYFSEAFGPGVVRDQLSQHLDSATFRLKVALGFRAGDWALEPFIATEMTNLDASYGNQPALTAYGIDVKRIMRVSSHVSVYVRGSMSHLATPDQAPCCVLDTTAALLDGDIYGYSGRGLGVGVGAQISGKVPVLGLLAWPLFFTNLGPKMNAGLFIEDSYDYYRLQPSVRFEDGSRGTIDAAITRWTFGFAVGSDF
jgi:hypothetical protein